MMLAEEHFKNHSIRIGLRALGMFLNVFKEMFVAQDIIHAPSCLKVGKKEYFASG